MNLDILSPNEKKVFQAVQNRGNASLAEAADKAGVAISQYYTALRKLKGNTRSTKSRKNASGVQSPRNGLTATISTKKGTISLTGLPDELSVLIERFLN